MGDDEPIEFLLDSSSSFLLRSRRRIRKARMQTDAMARNPRTVITAIAQCGKPGPAPSGWTDPEAADDDCDKVSE